MKHELNSLLYMAKLQLLHFTR